MIDLDGFKQVNDQQGYAVGDQVLKSAAAAMRAVVRDTDLLARVGGDEFTVLSLDPTARGLDE
ncbi:MAG: diguanylate cyclase, partial [Vulcanococcus sp.]